MSRKNLSRAAIALAVASGVLLLAAGPAMANDSTDGADGAGGGSSDFSGPGPSSAHDVTPAGVPVFGGIDSVKGAPQRVIPGAGGNGSY